MNRSKANKFTLGSVWGILVVLNYLKRQQCYAGKNKCCGLWCSVEILKLDGISRRTVKSNVKSEKAFDKNFKENVKINYF